MNRAIILKGNDNVATLIDPATSGAMVELTGENAGRLTLRADIPYGHKCAVADIGAGQEVIKYGQVIGRATADIRAGDHVHIHNVEALRARGDQ